MKKALALVGILAITVISSAGELKYGKSRISGPYTHKNLTVFLIHGESRAGTENILTLDEALSQKKIRIYETSQVDQLFVENLSDKMPVFIQSGDIIKGGKQDRVMRNDLMIEPNSGKVPISSFCVEQGRWSRRGTESQAEFSSSKKSLSTRELKLANKYKSSQGEVWNEVAQAQQRLGENVGKLVKKPESVTSLQLTLEDKDVEKHVRAYMDEISKQIGDSKEVIGFAFAVNNKLSNAHLYGNAVLFRKLWDKMLESCAVEALSELNESKRIENSVTVQELIDWLNQADKGKESQKSINDNIQVKIRDNKEDAVFETYEKRDGDKWVHKEYLKK
jgi:hypothetical protein